MSVFALGLVEGLGLGSGLGLGLVLGLGLGVYMLLRTFKDKFVQNGHLIVIQKRCDWLAQFVHGSAGRRLYYILV